jgi:hypothetical protein
MRSLKMETWSLIPHRDEWQARKGYGGWWLGGVSMEDATLPTDERLKQLFVEKVPGKGELFVVSRGSHHVLIAIPTGTKPALRRPFLEAVEAESR